MVVTGRGDADLEREDLAQGARANCAAWRRHREAFVEEPD